MKLTQAIEELLLSTRANGRSEHTVEDYAQKLAALVEFLGDQEINQVTTRDLRRYIEHLMTRAVRYKDHPYRDELKGGLSRASVASYGRVARRLFSFLYTEGFLASNPARRLSLPRPLRGKPKAIALADIQRLLEAIEGDDVVARRDRALLLLLCDTGCRLGGLVGLMLEDLDLDQRMVYLREKGGRERFGFFSEMTRQALEAWLEVRPEDRGEGLFVGFGSRGNGALSAQGVREILRRLKRKAGVKGPVNPHSFRHAFAREYLKNGGDLASLADIMGHSDVQVTWQAYAVFTVEELKAAHARNSPVVQLERNGLL